MASTQIDAGTQEDVEVVEIVEDGSAASLCSATSSCATMSSSAVFNDGRATELVVLVEYREVDDGSKACLLTGIPGCGAFP